MPVLYKDFLQNGSIIGVWQITETVDELLNKVSLTSKEDETLKTYKNENRKKHWLSYRALIQELINEHHQIEYSDFGKPFLKLQKSNHHISITHSGAYSAVIINKNLSVGIDIEEPGKRIERVTERFLSQKEIDYIDEDNKWNHLTICWTVKEALFKIHGNLCYDFKTEIFINPFTYAENGELDCIIYNEGTPIHYKVYYHKINSHFIAYVTS